MRDDRTMNTPAPWSPDDSLHAISLSEANAWRRAIDLCAGRIRDNGPDQQTDARLYMLALRQFLKAAALGAETVADTSEAAAMDAARQQFAQAVPGAKEACDMIEHFSEYARGTGNLQQPGVKSAKRQRDREAAARDWPLGYDPATDAIHLGRHLIPVALATEQAKLLHHAIWQAVRHG